MGFTRGKLISSKCGQGVLEKKIEQRTNRHK